MKKLALVLSLAASGCALVGPDYKRPDVGLPGAYTEPAPPGTTAMTVPADWWTLYRDATLDGLVHDGLARNADVRVAIARVEEAEAALREARATVYFPLVNGNAGATRSRVQQNGNYNSATTYTLGLSTSFEIDLWGRLRRAEYAVRDQLYASEYARDTVALSLAASIARTYFAVRSLDAQLIASRETLQAANESLGLARKRLSGGVASELDVAQAGSLRAQASAQVTELERQRSAVVHQLGVLTGRLDLAVAPGDFNALPVPPLAPAGLPSQLLERRPDVREAEATLEAATEQVGFARGSQFPALSLTASGGVASGDLSELFTKNASIWSIGGNLLGPILDGGRYRARTEQAQARAKQAEGQYQRAVENAFRDVNDALTNVGRAGEAEVDLQDYVAQSARSLKLARLRYEQGYSAYLEVLDAQRTLNVAQLALIRNRQAYLSYTVDLMNALGGGWNPDSAGPAPRTAKAS